MNTIQSTILRFEHPDKRGLYQGRPSFYAISGTSYEDRPSPYQDSLFNENCGNKKIYHFVFGFLDMEQLRAWIYKDEWLRKLYEYNIKCYEFSGEVIVGHTQAAIRKETMTFVRELTLEDFGIENNEI